MVDGLSGGTFTRGTSTHSGTTAWAGDAAAAEKITTAHHDYHDQLIAAALSLGLYRDGQGWSALAADLPMNSHRFTGVADGASRTDFLSVKQFQDGGGFIPLTGSAGSSTAQTATAPFSLATLTAGMLAVFQPSGDLIAGCTLDVNGLGPKELVLSIPFLDPIKYVQVGAYGTYLLRYDGNSGGKWMVLNPSDDMSMDSSYTAAGTTQGTATALRALRTLVTAGTGGVKLISCGRGITFYVTNLTGVTINIYPPSGDNFLTAATNAPVAMPHNSHCMVTKTSGVQWLYVGFA